MRAALVGGQHGTRGNRRERRAEARSNAVRPYLTAGVALIAASTVTATAVAPVEPPRPVQAETRTQLDIRSADVRLTAASSILNIPLNLLVDIINMPHSELQAFELLANAQLWGGNWLVTGPSNVWGTDPADAARFVAAAAMLIPIPALSGFDTEISAANPLGVLGGNGIGQQFWRFMAAEVAVNPNCDAEGCVPTTPMSPITGIRGIDILVWSALMFTGLVDVPMISDWFKVPLPKLVNGNFDPAIVQVESPSGEIYTLDGFGIPGTVKGPNGENLLPWAGTPINLNPAKPFRNWFNHLMADPAGNPIKPPSLEQFGRALQTLAAGIHVGFDPFTPGSVLCPNYCTGVTPEQDYPAIVEKIGSLWPGNEKIDTWLAAYKAGRANTATDSPAGNYISANIELLKNAERFWDFSNAPMDPKFSNIGSNPSDLAPFFHNFWKSLGLNPDPLYPAGPTATVAPPQSQLTAAPLVSASLPAGGSTGRDGGPAEPITVGDDGPAEPITVGDGGQGATITVGDGGQGKTTTVGDDGPAVPITDVAIGQAAKTTGGDAGALDSASKPVEKPKPTTTPSTDRTSTDITRYGNMAVPGKVGGNGIKSRGGLGQRAQVRG